MEATKEKLVTDNIQLVHYMADKLLNLGIEYDELISLGNLGLVKAARVFDENKGYKFSTYACTCIQNEILTGAKKIERRMKSESMSLDAAIFEDQDGNQMTLTDFLPCQEKGYSDLENTDWLRSLTSSDMLSDKEKKVFIMTLAGSRQEDIGRAAKVSQSYASRLFKSSVRKLQKVNFYLGGGKAYGTA